MVDPDRHDVAAGTNVSGQIHVKWRVSGIMMRDVNSVHPDVRVHIDGFEPERYLSVGFRAAEEQFPAIPAYASRHIPSVAAHFSGLVEGRY
jgi:hypothetical protein